MGAEVVAAVVATVVPLLIGKAFAWLRGQAEKQKAHKVAQSILALEVGVNETWERTARTLKHASEDGKFTDAEKAALRSEAIEIASAVARKQGVDVLKTLGVYAVNHYIAKIVNKRKGE